LVTGIFCEPFSAANAIAALLRRGFADHDIHAVGVLEGHAPAVSEFLLAIGLPSDVAAFYSDCFDDGAVLLMVHVDRARRKKKIANIPLAALKLSLVIFYCFIDVPYLYLIYTSSFVSLIAVALMVREGGAFPAGNSAAGVAVPRPVSEGISS